MFKSKEEAYLNPSNFKSKSCTLGMGNGFLLILILSPLKSEMKLTLSFCLGNINIDTVHSELFLRFKTPKFTNLLTLL